MNKQKIVKVLNNLLGILHSPQVKFSLGFTEFQQVGLVVNETLDVIKELEKEDVVDGTK